MSTTSPASFSMLNLLGAKPKQLGDMGYETHMWRRQGNPIISSNLVATPSTARARCVSGEERGIAAASMLRTDPGDARAGLGRGRGPGRGGDVPTHHRPEQSVLPPRALHTRLRSRPRGPVPISRGSLRVHQVISLPSSRDDIGGGKGRGDRGGPELPFWFRLQ